MAAFELVVVGCSHKTAPVEVRETLAFAPDQVVEALRIARGESVLQETMILSTCNRTEFYSLALDPQKAESYIRQLVSRFKGNDLLGTGSYGYAYRDRDMVRHLFRVVSGLDSMVLGEVQILGQVKDAYNLAVEGGSTGLVMNRLMSAALRTGKRARSETDLGAGAVSFASAAVALTTKIFSDLSGKRVLIVGSGETGRLAAQHFAEERPAALLLANRTPERAEVLAAQLDGEAISFGDIAQELARTDVVVCATRSPDPVIGEEIVRRAMRERPSRPLVLVDMAVPRDVDPAVARMDNVFLYTLEALQTIVDQNLTRRRREVPKVEGIVDDEIESFFRWARSLEVTPLVRELRDKFEAMRAEEIIRHARLFPGADVTSLEALSKALLNKFLHHPTTRIKAIHADSEDAMVRLDTVRELFDLKGRAQGGDGALAGEAGSNGEARPGDPGEARSLDTARPGATGEGTSDLTLQPGVSVEGRGALATRPGGSAAPVPGRARGSAGTSPEDPGALKGPEGRDRGTS